MPESGSRIYRSDEKEVGTLAYEFSRGRFRFSILFALYRAAGRGEMYVEREDEKLCKSSVTGGEHEALSRPVIPPENRFAYNKPKRLLREIAFLQTEAFDVAFPF